jgi:hypothetical protein
VLGRSFDRLGGTSTLGKRYLTSAGSPWAAVKTQPDVQRGHDVKVLEHGQYGYLASRAVILHPAGGQRTSSCALGEALPQLEAVERELGKDLGELMRERRRQRGVSVSFADRVLPFYRRVLPSCRNRRLERRRSAHPGRRHSSRCAGTRPTPLPRRRRVSTK